MASKSLDESSRWFNPTRRLFSLSTGLVFLFLVSNCLTLFGPFTAHASTTGNIITNGGFEQGLTGWGWSGGFRQYNFACEGVANSTASIDTSRWAEGGQSLKVFTHPVTQTWCTSGNFTERTVGFTQFPQRLPPGLTFSNLTDSPGSFSFWFYLEPYGSSMAGFDVRIFGGEQIAELDYVIDPDPSTVIGYANHTDPSTGKDGFRAIILSGYQPGQWHHFSRNLKADWTYPTAGLGGLNVTTGFYEIQFEGDAITNGGIVETETYWLDDVRVYLGNQPPPFETHYVTFNFMDHNGNNVDGLVPWKLFNASGTQITYTLGQNTLPPGPYFLQACYRTCLPQTTVLSQQMHLDTNSTMSLPMFSQSTIPGGYVILDHPVNSLAIAQENSRRLAFTVHGIPGTTYRIVVDAPVKPGLVELNGNDLAENVSWQYSYSPSLLTLTYQSSGTDPVSVIFGPPPFASFTVNVSSTSALTQAALDASSSSDPGGTIAGYFWNFGDGQTGNGISINHTYLIGGSYTITLNVTETGGASRESSQTILLTPNTLPSISFVDMPGYSLGDKIKFRILDPSGSEVSYGPGQTVPYGAYILEAYYQGYRVYKAPLSFSSQRPVQLQLWPLDSSSMTYIAVNSAMSEITITQSDKSQIAFTLSGTGPYLIVVNVPSRPFFVEKNGARTADWVYNSTSQTIAIQSDTQGSFLVSLVEPRSFPYLYLGTAIAGILAVVSVALFLVKRARKVSAA